MFSEEMEVASPPWGSHPHGVKGLWALGGLTVSTVAGHRTGHKPYAKRWVEAVVKPREDGAYAHQHLNFIPFGKVHGRKAKASNRTTGNPAVRHYRGATGNVSHGGIVNPSCIERAGMETPHLKRGAPVLYPNTVADNTRGCGGILPGIVGRARGLRSGDALGLGAGSGGGLRARGAGRQPAADGGDEAAQAQE